MYSISRAKNNLWNVYREGILVASNFITYKKAIEFVNELCGTLVQ